MKSRIVSTIFFKELRVMLRDKRTLIAMIGVPIILYPAILIITSQMTILHISTVEESSSRVTLQSQHPSPVMEWLAALPKIEFVETTDPEQSLLAGRVDAVVVVKGHGRDALTEQGSLPIEILYDATEARSRVASRRVFDALRKIQDSLLARRLEAERLPPEFVNPLFVTEKNVAPPTRIAGTLLATLLPVIMVLMVGIGAFYPAVDLTAGEKERGTFETLLSTPTSKFEIVCGKFLAVFTISLLTGLLNLGSMALTFAFHLSDLLQELQMGAGDTVIRIPPATGALMVLVMIPLALFISALMMSVAVFARSFKEAQNYVTPFFIAITIPAAFAGLPGLKLTAMSQFLPIVNVGLLFKALLTDRASAESVFTVFFSTAVFAALALVCATWLFQREELILAEEGGIPLSLRRAHLPARTAPTAGMGLVLYAFTLLLIFYVGVYTQSRHALFGLLITEWLLILAPTLGLLWYARVDLAAALNLRRVSVTGIAGAMLTAFSWLILAFQLGIWNSGILPMPEEMARQLQESLRFEDASPVVLLLVLAVSPALCEEALFRGAMLSGFRRSMSGWVAVPLIGILFGLYHISIYRVALTGLTGIVLTYLVWRSGSIWTGVLAHFIVNGAAVLVATRRAPAFIIGFLEQREVSGGALPIWLLAAAVAGFAAGVALVSLAAPRRARA